MTFERIIRRLLGRGRRRHFGVTPPQRTIRKLFERYPLRMNALCYGSLYAGAEFSQQTIKHFYKKSLSSTNSSSVGALKNGDHASKQVGLKYDMSSVKKLALWGTVVIAPIFTHWYKWLEKRFPPCSITGIISNQSILKKCLLDQFVFTPPLLCLFFGGMAALECATWKNVETEITTKLPTVFFADCIFWIPVQAFNFAYVPPTWRVLYIGVMTFIWTNVLCFARSYKSSNNQIETRQ